MAEGEPGDHPARDAGSGRPSLDPAWFSAVMGTAGTAAVLALNPLGIASVAPFAKGAAWLLVGISAVSFAILVVLLLRGNRARWEHVASPVHGPAFATIPGAMLVIITAVMVLEPDSVLPGFWWWSALAWNAVGAFLAVAVTIRLFVAAFVRDAFPVERMGGVWFIPESALLLAGLVAARLALTGPPELSRTLFVSAFALVGAGAMLFGLTAALFFTRLVLYPHVRSTGAPSMWIMISPLSLCALALNQVGEDAYQLTARVGDEPVEATHLMAMLLWGFSLWWIAAATAITWDARGSALTSTPADWAYVFPPAAVTIATLVLARVWDSLAMELLGALFAVALLTVWILVGSDAVRRATRRTPA